MQENRHSLSAEELNLVMAAIGSLTDKMVHLEGRLVKNIRQMARQRQQVKKEVIDLEEGCDAHPTATKADSSCDGNIETEMRPLEDNLITQSFSSEAMFSQVFWPSQVKKVSLLIFY